MEFRKDINGLRAIAVIAVIIFHFNPSWMPGGFSGVDVFFVISGFLMSGIIFRGLENNSFSIIEFYVSRANRIIPALAVLCLILLLFGWFFLTPLEYRALGKHIASSIGFLSNIVYWSESGYFGSASKEKWLLHTWSLSVEWQFYILYPLILVAMKKFMGISKMKVSILIGMIFLFCFSVYATKKWAESAYYLLPTRAWEMMFGGVAYLFPFKLSRKNTVIMEILGILLIVTSYLFVSKDNLWPGYLALLPVLGTFFVIQSHRNNSILTGNIIFQKIGSWSYSIYLWHWPLVVAIYIYSLPTKYTYIGIFSSIFIGFISNKYIENAKFRKKFNSPFEYLKCKPIYITLLIGFLGTSVFITNGVESHYSMDVMIANNAQNDKPKYSDYCFDISSSMESYCVFHGIDDVDRDVRSNVEAIVLGDSHGASLVLSVVESLSKKTKGDVIFYGRSGCLPVEGLTTKLDEGKNICSEYAKGVDDLINKYPSAKIIIANRLSVYFWGQNEDNGNTKLIAYHKKLVDLDSNAIDVKNRFVSLVDSISASRDLYIVKPIPEQLINIPVEKARALLFGSYFPSGVSIENYKERNDFVISMLNDLKGNVTLIDPLSIMCKDDVCLNSFNGVPLYYDDDHLSTWGAKYVSPMFDVVWN